jgi:RNA polymerase sigma factor (sigma-70 family)
VIVQPHRDMTLSQLDRRYRPALMAYFIRRVRNHAEAEDLTQEVFAKLSGLAIDDVQKPDAFIFQVAANLLRDQGRRERVRRAYRLEEGLAAHDFAEPFIPSRVLLGKEALNAAMQEINALPARTRAIFILFRIENMKQREIAEMFGISKSAVEKHLVRALTRVGRAARSIDR